MTNAPQLYIGIDVGSTTIKAVVMDTSSNKILWKDYQRHEVRQAEKACGFLQKIQKLFPNFANHQIRVFTTGSGGKNLARHIGGKFVQEVTAVSIATEKMYPEAGSVIELGGQDSKIIIFKEDPKTGKKKKIPSMNDKCAGGTGAVIDKINAKLQIPAKALGEQGYDNIKLHPVAGKCGVFAETDINSLQKQGIPTSELMASLFDAIVNQNLTVLTRGHTLRPQVLLLGGPNTFIKGMQEAWRKNIPQIWKERNYPLPPDKSPKDLIIVPDNAQYFAAIGAVEYGKEESDEVGIYKGWKELDNYIKHGRLKEKEGEGNGLIESEEELAIFKKEYAIQPFQPATFYKGETVQAFIGLDGGSTSTKAVLMNADKKLLAKAYQLSKGNPIEDTKEVLNTIRQQVEARGAHLEILGLATTGYAKDMLKDVLCADTAIVETVAHTRSALHYYQDVDVICDVGGQDIKIMILKDGKVKDFELNTQCSAGNGYFLQSTANDFGLPVEKYAEQAFKAKMSPEFGFGCAVFLQTDIVNFQRQGWQPEEILAGLATVLPKNIWIYVAKMPNFSKLGKRFILQGGTQHNLAAVKAQVDFIRSRYHPGEEQPSIIVHKHCGESGAIGAALEAIHLWKNDHKTSFIGLEATQSIQYKSTSNEDTRCNYCTNYCLRTFVDISTINRQEDKQLAATNGNVKLNGSPLKTRRLIVGNSCEKGSVADIDKMRKIKDRMEVILKRTPNMTEISNKEIFKSYKPKRVNGKDEKTDRLWFAKQLRANSIDRSKIRIGIPRVHLMYSLAPLFSAYFESLGIRRNNIVFSDFTDDKLYKDGTKRGAVDPCFPSKLYLSHVHNLLYVKHKKKPLGLLFCPMISDIASSLVNTRGCWICPSVMATPEAVKAAFTKEEDIFKNLNVRYVNTFLNLAEPLLFERQMFNQFEKILGINSFENKQAIQAGYKALQEYKNNMHQQARDIIEMLEKEQKLGIVVLGRPYHRDPGINHGILEEFQQLGYPILTQDLLPLDEDILDKLFGAEVRAGEITHPLDISDVWKNSLNENANMKIWAAKFVARHPNLIALELSNFKCGHDAPTYSAIEEIVESSGTPYFSFKDIDENNPKGSTKLRIETIDYFLKQYRNEVFEKNLILS
ncbi:MAG: putative CoA-substrate-specific enzyme activase [Saprospiraceae bacterium]|jgi:predicted CoA-substrate-specific enzyme activase